MKKKLSLLMVAFMAVAAFAGLTTWRAGSETSYTITFKDAGVGASDGTVEKTAIEDLIADGAAYVSATEAAKVYQGKEGYGIKFSSAKANGNLTLTLAQKVVPTKIAFRAQAWINSQGNADAASISINGKEAVTLTSELANYEVAFDGETEIEAITIAATKRAYITQITVFYNEAEEEPVASADYYVVGTMTEWSVNENYKMTASETEGLYEFTMNLTTTSEFKVVKVEGGVQSWYPTGMDNNYGQHGEITADGEYKITFNPAGNVEGWFNGYFKVEATTPAAEDINLKLAEGCDIAAAVAAAAEGKTVGNIKIELTNGQTYTFGSTVEVPASLTVWGNDAVIDASALEGNMFQMVNIAEPTDWTETNVEIAGVVVKGLKKALFYSNGKNYLINDFNINWVVVELAADATTFDFTKGSVAKNFTVTNSTFYAPTATTKSFYSSQSGQKATEAGEIVQTFKFHNNTMYNLATGKNFFSHRQSNQKWLAYDVQNNIFVNCGKSGQVIKGMNGGQGGANPIWTIKGNAFNFDGADGRTDTSVNEETGDAEEPVQESVAGIVTFTDAAAGDFNGEFALAEGAVAPAALGAPMWTINFNGVDTYTVAGAFYNSDEAQAVFLGTTWDATNTANDMEKYSDTDYAKFYEKVDLEVGNLQIKVAKNHNMDNSYPEQNVSVDITEAGKYDVAVWFNSETKEVRVSVEPTFTPAEPVYTVVGAFYTAEGEQIIFGGEKAWDEKNTAADMVIYEEYGCYVSKTLDVELLQGTLNYKVVKNHAWTENWGFDVTEANPNGNAEYKVSEAGKYDIIIKFNPDAPFENGYHVDCVMIKKTTGINNIAADNMDNAVIYNMQGVRVDKAQKGLYIVNGKKVVMK